MKKWIVTLGGAGLLPFGPGTWGSALTAAALFLAYEALSPIVPTDLWPSAWNALLAAGILLFGALSVWLGPWATRHFGRDDPGPFVLDEAAGICLTMLFLPQWTAWSHGSAEGWIVLAAFAAFRIFDISKPPPARQLEHLPRGWGILMDDLMAAVYANALCQLLFRLVLR